MTAGEVKSLIRQGEGISLEFKESRRALNRDVYETVCSFLNRHGGTLLLGVKDDGTVSGIDAACLSQMKKDFSTALNNPQKINPTAYLSIEEVSVEGAQLLRIYVPESSQVHRCNGRIYDRNEDGDFDITDHTRLVAEMYHRKQACYTENKIYPYAGLDELDGDLISKCRQTATFRRSDHPWGAMDNMALLKSAQLYQTDLESGKSGVTLAGLLLLGNRDALLSAVPHHRTDLIVRKVDLDRYDDRDFVDDNLVESYDRIMAFVGKHLPDPFYLEGTTSISLRDAIFREVASNILIHREYMNAYPAKLIIENGQVRTENSNKPHGFGALNPATFTPFPKNPVIASFFRQIGHADELGSGMRNLMKYGKAFGGADPELVEGDVFRITVKTAEGTETGSPIASPKSSPIASPKTEDQILELIRQDSTISAATIATNLGLSKRAVINHTNKLQESGRLQRIGSAKGGNWEVLPESPEASSPIASPKSSPIASPDTEDQILELIKQDSTISAATIATNLGLSKRTVINHTNNLQKSGRLQRIGSAKAGHWEVV